MSYLYLGAGNKQSHRDLAEDGMMACSVSESADDTKPWDQLACSGHAIPRDLGRLVVPAGTSNRVLHVGVKEWQE